jgi:hypothetical protein
MTGKDERERKAALMASLSTLIPTHLEVNLSVIWMSWVAPIHRRMMAGSEKATAHGDPRNRRTIAAY